MPKRLGRFEGMKYLTPKNREKLEKYKFDLTSGVEEAWQTIARIDRILAKPTKS